MNLDTIVGNETAQQIAKNLASRERITHETDVARFKTVLVRQGFKIVPEEFDKFFKDLEAEGFGALIYGRGKNPTRFRWFYSLRDIGQAAMNPGSHLEIKKISGEPAQEDNTVVQMKRQGRPKGSKNVVRSTRQTRTRTAPVQQTSTPGLVIMLTTSKGEMVPVNFEDIKLLSRQLDALKSKLG